MDAKELKKKQLKDNRKKIGQQIKFLREKHGYDRTVLSVEVGLPPNSIGQYERGETAPQPLTLIKLAEKFNTSVDFIVGHTDDPTPLDAEEIDMEKLVEKEWTYKGLKLTDAEKQELFKMLKVGLNLLKSNKKANRLF